MPHVCTICSHPDRARERIGVERCAKRRYLGARTGWRLLNVLAAACFAIAVVAGVPDRVVAATQTPSSQALPMRCPHSDGWRPTDLELHRILARHRGWLQERYSYDLQAPDAYLDHVQPAYPEWRLEARSHPEPAELCNADLNGENLSGANLYNATLDGTTLNGADLSGANLYSATLSGADLTAANLSAADLRYANLRGADLNGAQVGKAKLAYADLTGASYAPESEPPDPYVAGIRGLSTVHPLSGEKIGLVQLRKLLQEAGLRDAERAATYSIEHSATLDHLANSFWSFAWFGGVLRFVGFEVTTAYGLHPAYALGWIGLLGAVLTPVYMWAMRHPTATSGVVQVFPPDRLEGTVGDPAVEKERKKILIRAKNWRDALRSAAYFSLISAVNIGFEQFTPSDWIRRLQSREYSLEAVGWVRIVAGAQALLSVFLLAMWVLTQFGRPFG